MEEEQNYTEDQMLSWARHTPGLLVNAISKGNLSNLLLSRAAETMGQCRDAGLVEKTLYPLLSHTSDIVREGAVYGLSCHPFTEKVKKKFRAMVKQDPSFFVQVTVGEDLN